MELHTCLVTDLEFVVRLLCPKYISNSTLILNYYSFRLQLYFKLTFFKHSYILSTKKPLTSYSYIQRL